MRSSAPGRRFDAVIFDMDGVLVDSEPMQTEVTRQFMASYGVRLESTDEFLGTSDLDMFTILADRHRLPHDAATLTVQRSQLVLRHVRAGVIPMPGVPAVPRHLAASGYRVAVASSSIPEIITAVVDALGLADVFPTRVSGVEVPRGKPAPDVFLETARRVDATPARCLVIEDSRNGLLAAKAAGMACAVVPCGETRHLTFTEADWMLASLVEVAALL